MLVRAAAERLLEGYPSKSALGRDLGMTQGGISAFLTGKNDPSLATAMAVAKLAGVPLSALVPDLEQAHDERPALSSLPDWNVSLELAKRERPGMPPRGWDYAAQQNALFMVSVNPQQVIETAEFWLKRESEQAQNEAAIERTEQRLVAEDEILVEAQRRIAEARARGEKPPSLARMQAAIEAERSDSALANAHAKDAVRERSSNDAPPPPANDAPKKGGRGKR